MITAAMKFIPLVLGVSVVLATDEYITETQQECKAKSDFWSCGKYEVSKLISRSVTSEPKKIKLVDGIVDFVTLGKPESTEVLFPAARQISTDTGFRKFVKFAMRQIDAYLGSRAISIALPGQTRIADAEDPNNEIGLESREEFRAKKKKISMIVPLILLFKLFKVKVLVAITLVGVLFIKKVLLFLLFIAPSYLQMLKVCKMQHYTHPPPPHIEEHDFGSTGYGYGHTGHHHGNSYGKDWANSRAYTSHRPA